MKKYNLAIIGTFDLENFGDLMFPIVFKKQIEKRLKIDRLFLFSPNACNMPLNPEQTTVLSIAQLEKTHNEYGIDAIIFGGGDLARLDNAFAPEENYIPQNTSFDMLVYSAVVANKYSIPYLWNCPGVPFEFSADKAKIIKCLLDDFTDYISVREARSAEILKSCGCESKITVSPDTVLSVSTLIGKNENGVFDELKSEFSFLNDEYIVFQSMINNIDNFKEIVCEQLLKVSEYAAKKIVFLPIGNVHKDDVHIKKLLADFSNDNFVTFNRKLDIYETNAVLSNATAFIGTSLHGNIVSNSYKVSSIGLNLCDFVKLKNYFRLVERSEYCIKDITTIYETYVDMIAKNTLQSIDDAIVNVEAHFDKIVDLIKNSDRKKTDIKKLLDLCYHCNSESEADNNITVYYDLGEGYSSDNSIRYTLTNIAEEIKITLNIPQSVKSVRIDPADNVFCVVKNLRITCNDKKLSFNGNYFCDESVDSTLFFFNNDPQIIFDTNCEALEVDIQFSVIAFFAGSDMSNALPCLEDVLKDMDKVLMHNRSIIEQKEKNLQQKETDIQQKEAEIEQREKTIKSQAEKINQKDMIIKSKEEIIADINAQYSNLNKQYNDLINSFYWRLTALPRKITHKIKILASRNYALMKKLVFLKGFLCGGVSCGRKKLLDYKIFTGKIKVYPVDISQEQRALEEKYRFKNNVKFSILVPLYNTPNVFLEQMIKSVQKQTYHNWELCLADGSDDEHNYVGEYCLNLAAKDKRIKYKKLDENKGIADNTNECFTLATGDYYALFDHDDLLHPSALFEYADVINNKRADFIYCDEVTFASENDEFKMILKHHKPEFSPDTLRSYNYICHFTCFAKELYDIVGGFNSEYDGSQDYDLILRLTEKAKNIVRVPKILYYWRAHQLSVAADVSAKPYVVDSARKALAAHLDRIGVKGTVEESYAPTTYKINYEISGNPLVSIVIPTKDHIDDLDKCIDSIYSKSTYKNFEIIVVENNSTEQKTFDYYEKIQKKYSNINVVFWQEKVFNYSAINNYGARFASGEYILLLNNDVEVITPAWIEEMLMFAQRKDVGAVGAMLYYPDETIQHAGVILGVGGIAGHAHKYFDRAAYGYVSRACIAQNLSACTAACLLIRKDVFDEIDGLDENFAVAFNDIDLCMKIRKAGYLIVFTPYAEFYHYESKSRGLEDSSEKIARFNGEITRFRKKWGKELEQGDPYYNPNLTLDREDFSIK